MRFTRATGVVAVLLALLALPAALVDPVAIGFLLWAAILLGGLSSVSVHGHARWAVASIVLSIIIAAIASHYFPDTGFMAPTVASLAGLIVVIAIPLVPALLLVVVGWFRRRRQSPRGITSGETP
jgi:hypothetical protein